MEQEINFELLVKRPKYTRHSTPYKQLIEKVHNAANSKNPRTYCITHHSLETRTTKEYALHKNCKKETPMNYADKTLEGTENKFWKLCLKHNNIIGEEMVAVYVTGEDTTKIAQNLTKKNPIPQTSFETNYGGSAFYQPQSLMPNWNQNINHHQPNNSSILLKFDYDSLQYGYNSIKITKY